MQRVWCDTSHHAHRAWQARRMSRRVMGACSVREDYGKVRTHQLKSRFPQLAPPQELGRLWGCLSLQMRHLCSKLERMSQECCSTCPELHASCSGQMTLQQTSLRLSP